jgi:membrane-bound metal-dependent hydrolase YbcI (DUF457 family)
LSFVIFSFVIAGALVKGIAHFVTGVALATFFPEVVERAADGSILPVLGGIAGILPDTLDFKFVRFFTTYDLEIDPGPEPEAREIAEQVADAMRVAYESGEPQRVMLHTVQLGADLWRQYTLRFFPEQSEIAVRVGPVVNTGQIPLPGYEPGDAEEARIEVGVPMVPTYDDEITVDIFSGPSFKFERRRDRLHVHFLDWHRRWSHSLTLTAGLSLGAVGFAALVELLTRGGVTRTPMWIGLVVGLGFVGHIWEDQLGYMGSNLFVPFTRDRTRGLRLLRSGDAVPNFLTVWTAVMLILFNLDRFSDQPRLGSWWFLGLATVLPLVVLGTLYQCRRRQWSAASEALRGQDVLSEVEDVELS